MAKDNEDVAEQVSRVVQECIEQGLDVELDGLGTLRPNPSGGIEFLAEEGYRVFLAYVREDLQTVTQLHDDLAIAGLSPWLDKKRLLPGQDWKRSIERAISVSDFFVPCFSRKSVQKRGLFQYELRYALDCAAEMPLDDLFILPVRFEECPLPRRISSSLHYVDMFPHWNAGLRRLLSSSAEEAELRQERGSKLRV